MYPIIVLFHANSELDEGTVGTLAAHSDHKNQQQNAAGVCLQACSVDLREEEPLCLWRLMVGVVFNQSLYAREEKMCVVHHLVAGYQSPQFVDNAAEVVLQNPCSLA